MSTKQVAHYSYMTKKAVVKFELEIKLSTDFRLFFDGEQIPEELKEHYQGVIMKRNYFYSFEELNQKILDVIAAFETSFVEETKKKVILYQIHHDERKGQNLSLKYAVVQRIDVTKGSKDKSTNYYEERMIRKGGLGPNEITLDRFDEWQFFVGREGDYLEMPWSKERELWFQLMTEQLRNLALKLKDGFGKHAEILAQKIDLSNQGFLLEEPKAKGKS